MKFDEQIKHLSRMKHSSWAADNFLAVVEEFIKALPAKQIMEVGGGRSPAFKREKAISLGVEYTSNDISSRELSLAPDWVSTANFDIQDDDKSVLVPFREGYDLIFSKMVMEHVADFERAYENIFILLKKGGVSIAFHPVYYSFPFLLNRLLPEDASRRLLKLVFPVRNDDEIPKFPAYYSGCVISSDVRQRIRSLGFSEVTQIPFYHHKYYKRFPVVRQIHQIFSNWVMKNDFTFLASYSYTIAVK